MNYRDPPIGRMRERGFRIGQMELDTIHLRVSPESRTILTTIDFILSGNNNLKINNNNTSKYKFNTDTNHSCGYCFENFKSNDILCINSCYHYWCENCNSKLKNKCGFCRKQIEPNEFIDTLGSKGLFLKNEHTLKVIQIIKEDIDSIEIIHDDKIIDNDSLDNYIECDSMNLLD